MTNTSRSCCPPASSGPSSRARGLAPTNLSRLAADSGTVTSPLVPWNSCGAFMGAVLGVSALLYLPYALFNIFSPALSVLYGFTGFRVEKTRPARPPTGTPASTSTDHDQSGSDVTDTNRSRRSRATASGVTLATLTAMVVGGMVGAGVFSLPRRFATGDRGLRGADRLGHRRHRHADARLRVPDAGDPQAATSTPACTPTPRRGSASTSASSRRSATGPARVSATSPTGC